MQQIRMIYRRADVLDITGSDVFGVVLCWTALAPRRLLEMGRYRPCRYQYDIDNCDDISSISLTGALIGPGPCTYFIIARKLVSSANVIPELPFQTSKDVTRYHIAK